MSKSLIYTANTSVQNLAVDGIVEIDEVVPALFATDRGADLVYGTLPQVLAVAEPGHRLAQGVHRLEHDRLILREIHIRAHQFVKTVKGSGRLEQIKTGKAFDAGKRYFVLQ